jgi:hypothetical protein
VARAEEGGLRIFKVPEGGFLVGDPRGSPASVRIARSGGATVKAWFTGRGQGRGWNVVAAVLGGMPQGRGGGEADCVGTTLLFHLRQVRTSSVCRLHPLQQL